MSLLTSERNFLYSCIFYKQQRILGGQFVVNGTRKFTEIGLKSLSPPISHDACVSFRIIEARQPDLK